MCIVTPKTTIHTTPLQEWLSQKGMRINTSRGHLPLHCFYRVSSSVRRLKSRRMRLSKRLFINVLTLFFPPNARLGRGGIASRGSAWTVLTLRGCEHVHIPKWSKTVRVRCKINQNFLNGIQFVGKNVVNGELLTELSKYKGKKL